MSAYNVLFLCTGNSARSLLAEAYLKHAGKGRFHAYSAGSFPTGRVNPNALSLLAAKQLPTQGLRSKSWEEFAAAGAPQLDFILTVCDNAAGESCPIWPGQPVTAHWGVADPAAVIGSEQEVKFAFQQAYDALAQRIDEFIRLPIESLDKPTLKAKLAAIGSRRA